MGSGCSSKSALKVTPLHKALQYGAFSSTIIPGGPQIDEPEDEPSHAPSSSSMSNPFSGHGLRWNRTAKQSQRVRRQRGSSMKPGDSRLWSDGTDLSTELSAEQRRFLGKVLQKHFLFAGLEDDERSTVIGHMAPQKGVSGETIFNQGDRGDCCYIIQSGTFTVSIDDRNVKTLKSKLSFGELAMLYNVKRTATVTCCQEGTLWKMDGKTFRICMEKLSNKHFQRAMNFLEKDTQFCAMKEDDRKRLAATCYVQLFTRGEIILREGEKGDWMLIVIEGTARTVDRFGNTAVKGPGTMLGSTGMIYTKQQVLGATAVDDVACLALARSSLERLIGPVEDVLRRSAVKALLLDTKAEEMAFFHQLTDDQQNAIIDNFENAGFAEGDAVISAGSQPQLIVIIEGEVAVLPPGVRAFSCANVRSAAQEILTPGMIYGGSSLIQDSQMACDLVALNPVRLHRIGGQMISEALKDSLSEVLRLNEVKRVLSEIFLFKNLNNDQIELTVRSLRDRTYQPGDIIVQQGEEANDFYLIITGTIRVSKDGQQVRSLGRWDYFGERALLLQERRSATCQAEDACNCLSLDRQLFANIVGNFRCELEHRINLQDLDITMDDLRLKAVVGRGSFGIVKLVYHRIDENRMYALKCVSKKQVVEQGQQHAMSVEREINAQCYHPYIMQFITTFQDTKNIYFLTEFLGGGDLFNAIREIGSLTKDQAQFFTGCIILAIEYLHGLGIMYRDLKPENVLLDFQGNAKLVDFGCCKKAPRANTLVGTPEYFAPEAILGKGYTSAIDWWAVGVMVHEFIVGPLPFGRETDDQLELFREILEAPLQFPSYVADETAVTLISGLLERTPELRLGASTRGAKEIKNHLYFAQFDWSALSGRYTKPPWTPNLRKLQAQWETHGGEKLTEDDNVKKDSGSGFDWTSTF